MNAREALQALLDGKTLVIKFPKCRARYIRLNGDRIEYTSRSNEWVDTEDIPLICLDFTRIKEARE